MSADRSLFDILGPIMIGPSSSHTAGAVRLGLLATAVFGRVPKSARIQLHGSFASTGKGHGTDLALVAGLLGLRPDDPGIATALDAAKSAGLEVVFSSADLGEVHPNTVRFELVDEAEALSLQGLSVGEISRDGANIAEMRVSRKHRGEAALMLIVTDTEVGDRAVAAIERRELVTRVRRKVMHKLAVSRLVGWTTPSVRFSGDKRSFITVGMRHWKRRQRAGMRVCMTLSFACTTPTAF